MTMFQIATIQKNDFLFLLNLNTMLLKSAHLLVIGSIFLLTSELSAEPLQSRNWPAARTLDADRLSLAGLRIVRSTHCTMVTDLPTSPSVDELPAVVDAAMIAWAKRFGLIVEGLKSWRVRVYLIGEQSRFHANRLMPMNSEFPQATPSAMKFGYTINRQTIIGVISCFMK